MAPGGEAEETEKNRAYDPECVLVENSGLNGALVDPID